MSHRPILLATILGLTSIAVGSTDAVADRKTARPKYQAKITIEAARAIALRHVPGTIVDEELEKERGRWVYEIEIRPEGGQTPKQEILIDADTGVVIEIEAD
jgi:uncharacterized membrane protein YkoI